MIKFPSIEDLNRVPEILSVKEVVATEKLHGTNFRVLFPAGMTSISEVQYGGRNEEFGTGENGSFYGGQAVGWFKSRPELLTKMFEVFTSYGFNDVTVYGEICGTPIQKEVKYAAPGEVFFRAFMIRVGENFLRSYGLFVEVCEKAGLPRVKEVWRGPPSLENFDALLGKVSHEGTVNGIDDEQNLSEGVVIQSNPLLRTVFGEYLLIKHKNAKFKERLQREKNGGEDTSVAEAFVTSVATPGRIINCLGRLRDASTPVKDDMADMKYLAPAMLADIRKECGPEWAEAVAMGATDIQIKKAIQKVSGNVYRRMLNEAAVAKM